MNNYREPVIRRFSEELKKRIVAEVESGRVSLSEAAREYGVTKGAVKHWLEAHGSFKPKRTIVEVVMKDEKEKIEELQKALAEAHLKLRVYDTLIDVAGKKLKMDLKKTFGTTASTLCKKDKEKSK